MSGWQYHNPVAVQFGAGRLDALPGLLAGRSAVLVTFPEAAGLGLTARVSALAGRTLRGTIADTQPNPDVAQLAALYEAFWREHADAEVIVAVGGGSTLDTAKALAVGTREDRFDALLALLADGKPFTPAKSKRLIAVPTTAGTGSEVTPFATIWDAAPERRKKYSLLLKETWAEAAIVDPALTLSLPATVTLHSALDALSHCLESIWNVNHNPVSDALAVDAAREVLAVLPALMAARGDLALRTRIARAALLAGLAFSNTKTALAHSISYDMTLRHGLPHGLACSFTLPMVMQRALGARPDRDAVLARVFDGALAQAPQRLAAFLEGLGVSTRFESYGVTAADAEGMVATALDGVRGRNFIGAAA